MAANDPPAAHAARAADAAAAAGPGSSPARIASTQAGGAANNSSGGGEPNGAGQQRQQQEQRKGQKPKQQQQQQQQQQQEAQQQQQQQQQQKQQQAGGKKRKRQDPVHPFARAVQLAAKKGSPHEAILVYEKAKEAGLMLRPSELSTIMQLCAGSSGWEAAARAGGARRAGQARGRPLSEEEAAAWAVCHIPFPANTLKEGEGRPGSGGGGGGGGGAAAGAGNAQQQQPQQQRKQQQQQRRVEDPSIVETEGWEVRERTPDELLAAVDGVWADMQAAGVAPDETIYTHLARAAAVRGDADAALAWARRVAEAEAAGTGGGGGKMLVRLRTYQPALVALALAGRAEEALAVAEEIVALGHDYLDLTEAEYALLLEAVVRGGTYAQFAGLMARMQADLTQLRPSTLGLATQFLASPAAAAAFGEGGPMAGRGRGWAAPRWVAVNERGFSPDAGEPLQMFDLAPGEWDAFADSIAGIARAQERKTNSFDAFIDWLKRTGKNQPHEIFLDGANIALYGQNFESGGFSMPQVKAMWDAIGAAHPGRRRLLIFHQRRIRDVEELHPSYAPWLAELREAKELYATPAGSNDDWYWLYACVRAKERGLLISNDELRDHIWALLRPKHFLRWKVRHIARYVISGSVKVEVPAPYTPCVQQLPGSGAWMLPSAERPEWLLVAPEPAGAAGAGPV